MVVFIHPMATEVPGLIYSQEFAHERMLGGVSVPWEKGVNV